MNKIERREFMKLALLAGSVGGLFSLISKTGKTVLTEPTAGLFWNSYSNLHTRTGFLESHLRTSAIHNILTQERTFKDFNYLQGRIASDQELMLFHTWDYLQEIKNANKQTQYLGRDRWSPYSTDYIFSASAIATGSAIDLLEAVYSGELLSGMAIIRPPGHHAKKNASQGYCIFNNVAVAVKKLRNKNPSARVAILDFDAHHGNGIQEAFYEDSEVLYISTHQNSWPHTGKIDEIGEAEGKGFNINIPLPAGAGKMCYSDVFNIILEPILMRFLPNIFVVAQGYDTHWRDPQSFLALATLPQANLFNKVFELSKKICAGKIAVVLEGGYHLQCLAEGVHNNLQTLIGRDRYIDSLGESPYPEPNIVDLIQNVRDIHLS